MIHHHEFWWRFLPKKELTRIYLSLSLRAFALSLIALFVPLYLYHEIGFTLQQTLSFYIFYSVTFAIFTPLAAKFSARFGNKHAILFSVPFYIAFIALLYLLPKINTPLVILGSLVGISLAFYWIGMHLLFYRASDHEHRGEEFGKRNAFMIVSAMAAPLIGGFLIVKIGFPVVFGLVSLILLSSGILLFLSRENHLPYHFSVRSIINRDHWKDSLFFASQGTRVIANGVIWPLFIFFILGSYLSLGLVGSILSGVSAFLVLMVGKYSDRVNKHRIIRWITGFESLSWFLRAMVVTVAHVFGATVFGAITAGVRASPIGALEYDKARSSDVVGYFVSREVFICLGRVLMLTFVLMTDSLMGGLIFQGFASFAALLF